MKWKSSFRSTCGYLDIYVKIGNVLIDGMLALKEIPGTSLRRTRRMSRIYADFISKK